MYLYEFEAKAALREAGLPVPDGVLIENLEDLQKLAHGGVLKVQVHAGGRGKAGGVVVSDDPHVLIERGSALWNKPFITAQTTQEGELIRAFYIEQAVTYERECYVSFVMNRHERTIEMLAFKTGGVNIEDSHTPPLRILMHQGWKPFYARSLGTFLSAPTASWNHLQTVMKGLYDVCVRLDATLLEINPLVLMPDNRWMLLDAKITIDDNALFRHTEYKPSYANAAEEKANENDLSYIELDGDIGCMVNGAGLAMATMDLVAAHGGKPANFLDVGGTATIDRIRIAFELLTNSKRVKSIFVNIVGGIVRCDILAQGMIEALRNQKEAAPVTVVRLQGMNEELGKKQLLDSGLPFIIEDDLAAATTAAVKAANL